MFGNKLQRVKNMSEYSTNDMTNNTRPYVFISYSHKDEREMKQLKDLFDSYGISYWYDKGLHSGDDWNSVIAKYLESASACVVLLSPNSAESEYVKNELSFAISRNIPIHILMLEEFEIPLDVDMMTCRIQRIKKEAGYENRLIDSLLKDLGTIKKELTFFQKIKNRLVYAKESGSESSFAVKALKWILRFIGKILRKILIFTLAFFVLVIVIYNVEEVKKKEAVIPNFTEFASVNVSEKNVEDGLTTYTYDLPENLESSRTQKMVNDYLKLMTSEFSYNKLATQQDGEVTWYWYEYTGNEDVTGRVQNDTNGNRMFEYDLMIAVWGDETYAKMRLYTVQEIELADRGDKFVEEQTN